MWKSIVRSAIVAGIVVFLWSMISWMVLPMHKVSMNKVTDESEVTSCVMNNAPSNGIYVIPSWEQVDKGNLKSSPFIFFNVQKSVDFTSMTRSMFCGILTQIIGAAFIAYLLFHAKGLKYWGRVWFVTIVGLVVAILGVFPAWTWWHFPFGWVFLETIDLVVGWFLGGLVMAKLIKN